MLARVPALGRGEGRRSDEQRRAPHLDAHLHAEGNWQRRRRRLGRGHGYGHGRRHGLGRARHHRVRRPTRTAEREGGVHHGRRDGDVDDRPGVEDRRVGFVDRGVPGPRVVEPPRKHPHVPVRAAAELEPRLGRRLVPVEVRALEVAVHRVAERQPGIDHGVRAIVRIARALIAERCGIADEVQAPVVLPVEARVRGEVVVHVRHVDGAEAAAVLVRHGVGRHELDLTRRRHPRGQGRGQQAGDGGAECSCGAVHRGHHSAVVALDEPANARRAAWAARLDRSPDRSRPSR